MASRSRARRNAATRARSTTTPDEAPSGGTDHWLIRAFSRIASDRPLRGTRVDLDRADGIRTDRLSSLDRWLSECATDEHDDATVRHQTAARLVAGGHGTGQFARWSEAAWWLSSAPETPEAIWHQAMADVSSGGIAVVIDRSMKIRARRTSRGLRLKATRTTRALPYPQGIDGAPPTHATRSRNGTSPAVADLTQQIDEHRNELSRTVSALDDEKARRIDSETALSEARDEIAQLRENFRLAGMQGDDNPLARVIASLPMRAKREPLPSLATTLTSVVQEVKAKYQQIVFLIDAERGAARSQYEHPDKVLECFEHLAELAELRSAGPIGESIESWLKTRGVNFAQHESEQTKERWGDERTFSYEGRDYLMTNHIRMGIAPDPRHHLRIHLVWEPDQEVWLVGHIGGHLTSRLSQFH